MAPLSIVVVKESNKLPAYSWGVVAEDYVAAKGEIKVDLLHLCQIRFLDETEFQTFLCTASSAISVLKENIVHSLLVKWYDIEASTATWKKCDLYYYWVWPLPFDIELQTKLGVPFTYPKDDSFDLKFIQARPGNIYAVIFTL